MVAKWIGWLVLALPLAVSAQPMATFNLTLKDGVMSPRRLEVPANRPVKIVLVNSGRSPAEFESLQLRKEKVLAPGVTSFVVFQTLSPGEYKFFDDFHPSATGVIVAK
jgi:heme/copper-type cytochrome/quinol oxidase subunit 2